MKNDSLRNSLCAALERKRALFVATDALRLLNAEASGTPGLVVEIYGGHCVAYDYDGRWRGILLSAAPEFLTEFGWQSMLLKDRAQAGEQGRGEAVVAAGSAPEKISIREGSLAFKVELHHPRNVGLFLDTRGVREHLRAHAGGKRVLNLFSYTCSLGLAALAGGADEVVNVDISTRYLEWGKENLRLNSLTESRAKFSGMDSERYLDWAAKQERCFDAVILDPPVFSRFGGRTFRFAEDYFRLVEKCASRLVPGGTLYAVTNFSGIRAEEFAVRLESAVTSVARRPSGLRRIPLPPDFDVDPESDSRPEGNALIFRIEVE
jgi:23S rRNA (cytosine1962-C5)-methyltransferase